jgi:hypothetical protein
MKTPGHAWSRVEDSCVVHVVVWHGVFNFEASLLVELKREVSVSWFLLGQILRTSSKVLCHRHGFHSVVFCKSCCMYIGFLGTGLLH